MRDVPDASAPSTAPASGAASSSSPEPSSGRITSKALLGERGLIEIEHGGRVYTLRVTQQGKLILTA